MTPSPPRATWLVLWAANLRAAQGDMTDQELADAVSSLGVPLGRKSVESYKLCLRQPTRPEAMWAIAKVLGVPGRDLFPLDLPEVTA